MVAEALGELEAAPPAGVPPSREEKGPPLVAEALELELELEPELKLEQELEAAPPAGIPSSCKKEGLPLVAEAFL